MKFLTLLFFFSLLCSASYNQLENSPIPAKLKVPNVGEIDYPSDKLEIQSESMRRLKEISIPASTPTKITLQQIGVNEGKNLDSYCRVILQESIGKNGDFLPRSLKVNELSVQEKNQIINKYKAIIGSSLVKEWKSSEIIDLNGNLCVELICVRGSAISGKPDVYIELYGFPQSSRQIDLILSCRVNEVNFWSVDFKNIKNSLLLY
jgi:hypothetical protein